MKFFVAGAKGMLASDLIPLLEKKGDVAKGDLPEFNITDIDCVRKRLKEVGPDIVINCAAYTAVDRAEEEEDIATAVNGTGAGNLALVCEELGVRLVHISTDFVFDGQINRPYVEEDITGPVSAYGRSKLEGERQISKALDDYIIVRTSWLYGANGNNFVKTISHLALEKDDLGIVYDQVGTPTYTKDLAEGLINLIDVKAEPGIYHFSNEGVCSWYDFACEIVKILQDRGESLELRLLRPIRTEEYPTPAVRPRYSVLDKAKYKRVVSKDIPYWRDGLIRYFNDSDLL